jgi:hypothetical protein
MVCIGHGIGTVGDHDQGFMALPDQIRHEFQNDFTGFHIQVPGGFIGQEDIRVIDQGPYNGHPLLLSRE